MKDSFLSARELKSLGLKSYGKNVLISRKASFYGPESISIGHHVRIDDFCMLSGGTGISLGNYIHLGCFAALYGGSGIEMGNFSGLSARVTVYSESDDFSGRSVIGPWFPEAWKPAYHKGKVIIGKYVQIGVNSTILPGVTIGEGAAVGAHSLVTKDCQPWTIYFGAPAVKTRARSPELRERLINLEKDSR
jgi:acetyltransferase-like isoleucine patch superfamily enzyme